MTLARQHNRTKCRTKFLSLGTIDPSLCTTETYKFFDNRFSTAETLSSIKFKGSSQSAMPDRPFQSYIIDFCLGGYSVT